jgi:hypothetical protein
MGDPCQQGKKQGISSIQSFSANNCPENICEFSGLQNEFPARQNRESIRYNRETIPPYQGGTGKRREVDPRAHMSAYSSPQPSTSTQRF